MWEFLLAPVDVLLSILFRQRENKDKYLDPDFPECLAAALCLNHTTPIQSQPLGSDVIERLTREGCNAWGMVKPTYPGFKGRMLSGTDEGGPAGVTKVMTDKQCALSCMWSDLPIMAGSYGIKGKQGVYYEVEIKRMGGIIAIGSACLPYPNWRFPGWHSLSVGLHLDDFKIYHGDPHNGQPCGPDQPPYKLWGGTTIGFGYEFASSSVFFTCDGRRLPSALREVYVPRENHDVYAAIGVLGANDFEVNFGSEAFKWEEGNCWAWKVEGHVGSTTGSPDLLKSAQSTLPLV